MHNLILFSRRLYAHSYTIIDNNPDEEKMVRRSAINSGQSTQPNRNPIDGAYIAQHPLLSECGIEKDGRTAPDIKVILYPTNSGLQRQ